VKFSLKQSRLKVLHPHERHSRTVGYPCDGRPVLKSASGDDTDDLCPGINLAPGKSLQSPGQGNCSGRFGEDSLLSRKAALQFVN